MLPWVILFIVLVVAGLGVLGLFAWRLFGDVRHLGAAVTDASARLGEAMDGLAAADPEAAEAARGGIPRPRASAGRRG